MFFKNYLFHALIFFLMFLLYSLFALITNINIFDKANGTTILCVLNRSVGGCGLSPLGAGSKILNQSDTSNRFSQIQSWISVAFVILWGMLYLIKTIVE